MNDQIRFGTLGADPDGSLQQTAEGYFDFRKAEGGANVRQLQLANIIRDVENVSVMWTESVYHPHLTETEVFPPRYVGDRIVFFWSRPITKREQLADVKKEALTALEAAIDTVVAAGYDLMNYPD